LLFVLTARPAIAAPSDTLPESAIAMRLVAGDGTTLIVSPEPGAAIVAACVAGGRTGPGEREDSVMDGELRRDLARRGGDALLVDTGALSTVCVAAPTRELAFVVFAARRIQAGIARKSGRAPLSAPEESDNDSAPGEGGALLRLQNVALEGSELQLQGARDGLVIAVSGAVTAADVTAVSRKDLVADDIRRSFGPLRTRQSSERLSVVETPGPSPRTAYAWLVPDTSAEDAAALAVSAEILSGPGKSRLPALLVERSLARRVTFAVTPVPGATLASVFVESTTRTSIDRVRRFVDGSLKQLRLVGPTRGEVQRARARLMVRSLATWEDPVRRAAALLAHELLRGDARRLLDETRALAGVTPERVRRVFAERFVDARRTTIEEYPPLWPADDARLSGYELHTIEPTDTLENLARRFRIAVTSLARANDLDPRRALTPGQPLWIPPR
jgi:hypothetical protein